MKDEKVTSFQCILFHKNILLMVSVIKVIMDLFHKSQFFSRELYFLVARFTNFKLAGDYFLLKKMSKQAKLIPVNFKCGIFRKRKGQLSGDITKYYKDINKNYSYKINLYRFFLSSLYFIFFGHKF